MRARKCERDRGTATIGADSVVKGGARVNPSWPTIQFIALIRVKGCKGRAELCTGTLLERWHRSRKGQAQQQETASAQRVEKTTHKWPRIACAELTNVPSADRRRQGSAAIHRTTTNLRSVSVILPLSASTRADAPAAPIWLSQSLWVGPGA